MPSTMNGSRSAFVKIARDLEIPDILIAEAAVCEDERGASYVGYDAPAFTSLVHYPPEFVFSTIIEAKPFSWRGLHYQIRKSGLLHQARFVRVLVGEVFNVAVDLRKSSATFGQVHRHMFKPGDRCALFIPAGFAHGFLAGPDGATIHIETTAKDHPDHLRRLNYDDPALGIKLPKCPEPIKIVMADERAPLLAECETFP
jgi:dTDP-4-dehydrorhamnose 3,5-epimerase